MSLEWFVYCESGEAQYWQGVRREASAQGLRKFLCDHFSAGNSDESDDLIYVDGDIGRADMMSKLILPSVALKEAIEIDISAAK